MLEPSHQPHLLVPIIELISLSGIQVTHNFLPHSCVLGKYMRDGLISIRAGFIFYLAYVGWDPIEDLHHIFDFQHKPTRILPIDLRVGVSDYVSVAIIDV